MNNVRNRKIASMIVQNTSSNASQMEGVSWTLGNVTETKIVQMGLTKTMLFVVSLKFSLLSDVKLYFSSLLKHYFRQSAMQFGDSVFLQQWKMYSHFMAMRL